MAGPLARRVQRPQQLPVARGVSGHSSGQTSAKHPKQQALSGPIARWTVFVQNPGCCPSCLP